MNLYAAKYCAGELIEQETLWKALELEQVPHLVISLVGAGGKTTTMFRLAEELSNTYNRVLVTTSTRILCPQHKTVVFIEEAKQLTSYKWNEPIVVVAKGMKQGKLLPLDEEEMRQLSQYADVLLVEADGAKRLPLKVPTETEPVILPETDVVIACVGIDCIGSTFECKCFREDQAKELLQVEDFTRITPKHVAEILTSKNGSKKGVDRRTYRIVLNKADREERIQQGIKVIEEIYKIQEEHCVITCNGTGRE